MSGTQVGTIEFGVDIEDIQGQLKEALADISKEVNKSLGVDTSGMERSLEQMVSTIDTSLKAVVENTRASLEEVLQSLKGAGADVQVPAGDVTLPSTNIPKMAVPRAPPLKVDMDATTQIKQLEDQLSIIDEKWEVLDRKTRQHYETVDKLKAEYADLQSFLPGQNIPGGEKLSADLDKASAAATRSREQLLSLEHAAEKVRAKISELQASQIKVDTAPMEQAVEKANNQISESLERLKQNAGKTSKAFEDVGTKAAVAGKTGSNGFSKLNKTLGMALKRIVIMATLYKAIRVLMAYVSGAARQNKELVSSLNQVKLNLAAAFQPILDFIIPALAAMARVLATVTAYLAAFLAMIFGTTYKAAAGGAKGLKAQTDAIGGVGGAAGGAGKAVEKLKRALAGFDEINVLSIPEDSAGGGGGGGGGVGIPDWGASDVMPGVQEKLNAIMAKITQLWAKLKQTEAFQTLKLASDIAFARVAESAHLAWLKISTSLAENIPLIVEALSGLGLSIGEAMVNVGAYIGIPLVAGAASAVLEVGATLIDGFLRIGASLTQFVSSVFQPFFDSMSDFLGVHGEEISNKIYDTWDFIAGIISDVVEIIVSLVESVFGGMYDFLRENSDSIRNTLTYTWETIWNIIRPIWDIILDVGTFIFGELKKFFEEVFPRIREVFKTTWETIWNIVEPIWLTILDVANIIFGALERFWDRWGGKIMSVFSTVFGWLRDNFFTTFDTVWGIVEVIFDKITIAVDTLRDVFKGIVEFVSGVFTGDWERAWDGVKDIISSIARGIGGVFKEPLNWIIGHINSAISSFNKIKIPSWVPIVGGKGFNIAQIPQLARGGVVAQPTLAMVGEKKREEAIVPLDSDTGAVRRIADLITSSMGASGGDGGDLTVVLQLPDGSVLTKLVIDEYQKMARQGGAPALI